MLALPIFPGSRPPSIVGANELNFCVRDGNRWTLIAINTNSYGWVCPIIYVKTFSGFNHLFLSPSFSHQIKAQRSGFDLETTSHDTVGISRLRYMELCIMREELVTRTGFEPMLKA